MAGDVTILLPDLVDMEVESKWLKEFDDKKRQATGRLDALADHTGLFAKPVLQFPNGQMAQADYRARINAMKAEFGIEQCPITPRGAADLLRMAAYHETPFPDRDSSFRDAVIVLSILDDLDGLGQPTEAILVSSDDFFSKVVDRRSGNGSTLHVHKDLKSAESALVPLVTAIVVLDWRNERAQALEILIADQANLAAFVREHLEVPVGVGWLFGPRVLEVRGITVDRIETVTIPLPIERPEDGDVDISVSVIVNVERLVEISRSSPRPSTLRIGQSLEEAGTPVFVPPSREVELATHTVTVQARGHLVDGRYQSFTYLSVAMDK
jgi:hypothetical protein